MTRQYIVFARHACNVKSLEVGTFRAIGPAQAIQQYLKLAIRCGESPMEVTALPLQS